MLHVTLGRLVVAGSSPRNTGGVDRLTRLALAARDGDHEALEAFIGETQTAVWHLCRHLGDPETAEDLAQESYERAIAGLHRYRAEGPALHWLLTIARRTCADATRRRIRRRRIDRLHTQDRTASHAWGPTGYEAGAEHRSVEIEDLLARLDADRRAAFVLTQLIGLPYADAATVLGCPVGTIRSRVARARADLLAMGATEMGAPPRATHPDDPPSTALGR